jgi:dTDP-4-dehydrorhamnose 3,5-epimerase
MKFHELSLSGCWLIEPELFVDERGVFRRHFCSEEFSRHGIKPSVLQGNVSENPYLHTLRGFHFQLYPFAEGKTISCLTGSLFNIVVDLRPESRTYLNWEAITLDAKKRNSLYVSPGCANAFLTTDWNTIVHYYMSEMYVPDSYSGFRYDDPYFDFSWPAEPKFISDKDMKLPSYRQLLATSVLYDK